MSAADLYKRAWAEASRIAGEARVVASSKLRHGRLERARYYADFSAAGRGRLREGLDDLAASLALPAGARQRIEELLADLGEIAFVGAAEEGGQLEYRLYVGFFGISREVRQEAGEGPLRVGAAVAWRPGEEGFSVKEYEGRWAREEADERELIELALEDGAGRLAEACLSILALRPRTPVKNLLREEAGERFSVAVDFDPGDLPAVREAEAALRSAAEDLGVPPEELEAWLTENRERSLQSIAVGRDGRLQPFLTLYYGYFEEPPAARGRVAGAGAVEPGATGADREGRDPGRHRPRLPAPRPAYVLGAPAVALAACGAPADLRSLSRSPFGSYRPQLALGVALPYLDEHPERAADLVWLLERDGLPVAAVRPCGVFAGEVLRRLRHALSERAAGRLALVAVAGTAEGELRLAHGSVLPVVAAESHGLEEWPVTAAAREGSGSPMPTAFDAFLHRLSTAARPFAVEPAQRAAQLAATRLYRDGIWDGEAAAGRELGAVETRPALAVRPGAVCWEVLFTFFDPRTRLSRPDRRILIAVDVSGTVPAALGPPRSWSVYRDTGPISGQDGSSIHPALRSGAPEN